MKYIWKNARIDFSDISSFIFKVNHVFLEEKDNPTEKSCYKWGKPRW